MNELLGALIPLLMSGGSIADVIRGLGGQGSGVAAMDGLNAMLSASSFRARMYFPAAPSQSYINNAVESRLGRMGINPYTHGGQMASAFLGSMYHLAPDIMGGIMGIHDPRKMYTMIASGASGIGMASGRPQTDIFNPYSVMASQQRAMNMANVLQGLAMRQDGGFNLSYTHGLNSEELGLVSQRLLSSKIAYRDKDGVIDPESDTQRFKDNLENLGKEFNKAVSMMSKVTGSVKKTLDVLDRMAGGNFLGGTAEQARKVAERATKMAANIRITSAIAGIDPTAVFQESQKMMGEMSRAAGIKDPKDADQSGFSATMGGLAYAATAGYTAWAARHQDNATPRQKAAALMAVQSRAVSFMGANGSAFAAMVADNKEKFTEGELRSIQDALRRGAPEEVERLVRNRMGRQLYHSYMTNPAFKIAAMDRAFKNDSEFFDSIMNAGMEGNLEQTEKQGAKIMTDQTLAGLNDTLRRATGGGGFDKGRNESAKKWLRDQMEKKLGITKSATEGWSVGQLREALREGGVYDESGENVNRLEAAKGQIDAATMSDTEELALRQRMTSMLEKSGMEKWRLDELEKSGDVDAMAEALAMQQGHKGRAERDAYKRDLFGNKMSRAQAKREKDSLDRLIKGQDGTYTDKERLDALDENIRKRNQDNRGSLGKFLGDPTYKDYNMALAMGNFSESVLKLAAEGNILIEGKTYAEKQEYLEGVYGETTDRIISGMIGSSLGDISGEKLKELKDSIKKDMLEAMKGGKTVREAFMEAIGKADVGKDKDAKAALEKFNEDAKDKNTEIGRKLNGSTFFSTAKSVLEENEAKRDNESLDRLRDLLDEKNWGDKGGKAAFEEFMDILNDTGTVSEDKLKELRESGLGAIGEGKDAKSVKERMSDVLKEVMPNGLRGGKFAAFAAADAGKANELLAAMMYKQSGGDLKAAGFSNAVVDLVSGLDTDKAQSMNAVANAWGVGGDKWARNAANDVEKRMRNLGVALKNAGLKVQDVRQYAGGTLNADDVKTLESVVGESDRTLLKTLGGKHLTIGGKNALEAMMGSGIDAAKKEAGKNAQEDMLNIARAAGRGEGQGYELMVELGAFIRKAMTLFGNPIPVMVQNAV